MCVRETLFRRTDVCLLLVVAAGIAGCGTKANAPVYQENSSASSAASASFEPASKVEGSEKAGTAWATAASAASATPARFRQTFEDATRADRPEECDTLPKQTLAGKSLGVLYEEVRMDWDGVKLVSASGRLLVYPVTLQTKLGDIELELHPEWAPNHVRSFLALARVGYYDGLTFDRRIEQESANEEIPTIKMIEGGCPLGMGVHEMGSIGYWLKAELNEQIKHEEGIVGAWHGEDPDTAGCRFYICLSKAPTLDGRFTAFAKVVRGMEVARRIFKQPFRITDDDEDGCHRFEEAPVIGKVTVHEPVEGTAADK
jgi:peptidyl-prolyl cis-trans isomerase B (cyclophilin B)